MNGFIYKITNRVNNKVYIGQTRFTIEHRFKQHVKNFNIENRQQPLYLAFAKYGLENFIVEEVECVDCEKLDEREIYWIARYDSFKNGYNATLGGQKGCVYIWTDSQYEEIKNLYMSGFTIKTVAEKFNVSNYTITAILKSLNVKLRKNPMDINRIEKDNLIERYKNGVSLTQLGKELNTDRETVKRFLLKNNVELKHRSMISDDAKIQSGLIDDFINGAKYKDLEKKYNCDIRTIKKILVINGINIKAHRGFKHSCRSALFLTDSQCLEVIKRYNDKELVKDIAKSFNVNVCTIYEILKRYHVKCNRYNCSKSVLPLKED